MEHKTTYSEYIQNLSKQIQAYTKLGGSIYVPTKQNPLYDRLRQAKRLAKDEGVEDISFEKVYADCGVKFDRNFQRFKEFTDGLSEVADQNGYVDVIKNSRPTKLQGDLKSYLNTHAKEAGISPGEYLVLMTNFRYKNMVIQGDYVEALQEELSNTFPDGTVKSMKQTHPDLYNKVVHFVKYSPEKISYSEALQFFGLENESQKNMPHMSQEEIESQEQALLESLSTLYPDGQIKGIALNNHEIYLSLIKTARRNDCTPQQWLEQNGFDYPAAANVARLSRITVDAKEHEQKLLSMREDLLKDYDTTNADEVDMFNINFEIACKIGKELYGNLTQTESETVESPNEQNSSPISTIKQNIASEQNFNTLLDPTLPQQ